MVVHPTIVHPTMAHRITARRMVDHLASVRIIDVQVHQKRLATTLFMHVNVLTCPAST
jgi:hypothetical protein